jgi:hypothetical protein
LEAPQQGQRLLGTRFVVFYAVREDGYVGERLPAVVRRVPGIRRQDARVRDKRVCRGDVEHERQREEVTVFGVGHGARDAVVVAEDLPPVRDLHPPLALRYFLDVLLGPFLGVVGASGFGFGVEVSEEALPAIDPADPFEPAAPLDDLLVVVPSYLECNAFCI